MNYERSVILCETLLILLFTVLNGPAVFAVMMIPLSVLVALLRLQKNILQKPSKSAVNWFHYTVFILEGGILAWAVAYMSLLPFLPFITLYIYRLLLGFTPFLLRVIVLGSVSVFVLTLSCIASSAVQLSGIVECTGLLLSLAAGIGLFLHTQSREAEQERAIVTLQEQIKAKNKLLSTLSHELRTPLTVIKSSTEILLEERAGPIPVKQKQFLTATHDNVKRMIRLMENILARIKIEHAWFIMDSRPVNLRTIIRKVCRDMQPFVEEHGQTIRYTYPNQLSKAIADINWIEQVFINLIHNASKHIPDGGQIVISVQENEQCIVVSVSDNGTGIGNSEITKVFSEFYQAEDTGSNNLDGAGIGLAVVKDVVEKHKGKVYLGSVSGLGTTLSFTLPKEES